MLERSARLVGVDFGTKRVGVALADPLGFFAQPHGTYPPDAAVEELRRLHADQGIATVVIGWPLTEEGEEGRMTERVQQYINRLRNALPEVDIVKWDERYTSEMARRRIAEAGGRIQRDNRGRVDAAAAAVILQDYLER